MNRDEKKPGLMPGFLLLYLFEPAALHNAVRMDTNYSGDNGETITVNHPVVSGV
ncbi:hypothetical protein [Roseibium hamelinense]|uniref:hypothetical protein n=1 Tax=Roseibium hamelinense TaxID=150831 RepID=UPI0012BCB2E5|nr:hypothetical protein [Roseibium hamelinense]